MATLHDGSTVFDFDVAMIGELKKLPVKVFDSARPEYDRDGSVYLVYSGGDIIQGTEHNYQPITGFKDAAVIHTFTVFVSAPSAEARNKVQAAVREVVFNAEFEGCTPVSETGQLNSFGATDNTVKPIRYTCIMTYNTTLDRTV